MAIILHRNNPDGFEIGDENIKHLSFGSSYNDFLEGKRILLSDDQVAFRDANPEASVKEIIEMRISPIPEIYNPSIEEQKEAEAQRIEILAEYAVERLFPTRQLIDRIIDVLINNSNPIEEFVDYIENKESIILQARNEANEIRQMDEIIFVNRDIRDMSVQNESKDSGNVELRKQL